MDHLTHYTSSILLNVNLGTCQKEHEPIGIHEHVYTLPAHLHKQGFMQNQIIASHTCFGADTDVNCYGNLQTLNVSDDLKWTTNTCDTIYTHF